MNYRRLYLSNSLIFITIVTKNRIPILINHKDIIKKAYINIKKLYKFNLIAFAILPDHIHCIIQPENILEYPKIIKSFKYSFTKNVGLVKPTYKGNKLWQNRYWEHTIRDENDLNIHLNYIHFNPVKHNLVNNVKDWETSSFNRFIRCGMYEENWGSSKDIKNIENLNFE